MPGLHTSTYTHIHTHTVRQTERQVGVCPSVCPPGSFVSWQAEKTIDGGWESNAGPHLGKHARLHDYHLAYVHITFQLEGDGSRAVLSPVHVRKHFPFVTFATFNYQNLLCNKLSRVDSLQFQSQKILTTQPEIKLLKYCSVM